MNNKRIKVTLYNRTYKEIDIMKILDDAYKRCREEQRWV